MAAVKPWKHHPNARTCKECGSQRPGMQPLSLFLSDGRRQRGYWHLECFEAAKSKLVPLSVYVDGVNKGEVFKKHGRWHWQRGDVAVEPFSSGSTLEDVAAWACKCCRGQKAEIR